MLKKEKEKFYIISAFVALMAVVLVWQGIFSGRISMKNKILEILDKKAFVGAYSQREEGLPLVLANYTSAKEKIDSMNERFISGINSTDVDKFFSELEGIASDTPVSLEKIFIENPEQAKKTAKKPSSDSASELQSEQDRYLRLTVKGKYENLLSFINKLEVMPYFIDIKSVNIGADSAPRQDLLKEKNNSSDELRGIIIIKIFKKQNIDDKK